MQKTKGNLAFAEKYKLVQWLEQNLANLGGRTYDSISQEATQALGYYISENVLENINRDEELVAVKWKTSRTASDAQPSSEQLLEEINSLKKRVSQLESKLEDLLSVKRKRPLLPLESPTVPPYNVTCGNPAISQIFKGNEGARSVQDNAVATA